MKLKTLDDFNFAGKKVLLRSDLNSPVYKGKALMNDRIEASAKTIKELRRKGASVVILAHQSQKGKNDFISLKQHARLLSKFVPVKFVDDILGKKAVSAISSLKKKEVLLLDNVRFEESEFKPSRKNDLVRILSPHFDYYINDAFSVSHRKQASLVSFPQVLVSGMGRQMEKEVLSLEKIRGKNCLYILGGAKADVNIPLMRKGKNILVGGLFGHICLISNGANLGKQNEVVSDQLKYKRVLKKMIGKCYRPDDLAIKVGGKRKELSIEDFPSKHEVFDIGSKTISKYVDRIKKADCVFMKGTVGFCEEKQFCKGTHALLRAMAKNKGFTALGGGHLTTALRGSGISKKKFDYVSLSGGATTEYLSGKKLPGVEALRKGKKLS